VGSKNARFRRVYTEAQKLLCAVVKASLATLEHFGCGKRDAATFEGELRRTLITLLTCPENEYPLSQLAIEGGTHDKRKTLVREVIGSFGGDEADSAKITRLVMDADQHIVAVGIFTQSPMVRMDERWSQINQELREMYSEGCSLHDRLTRMLRDLEVPYKGSESDPDDGVEQTIELLKRFPDVAEPIYEAAGIQGLASYPPVANGKPLNAEGKAFKADIDAEVRSERRWTWFKIAGLIVAGIAATVITAATLGTGAAVLVGIGIGLVSGTAGVVSAHNDLQHTRDAATIGLASPQRVAFARDELKGAYALLVVDVATGGLLARFGGSRSISGMMRLTRVTTISAAGGGLGMAVNPNTWKSENAGAIILFGTVLGAAAGAAGHGIGAGMGRVFRPLGTKLQIGVSRADGVLEPGRTVKVCVNDGDLPVPAKVLGVDTTNNTVTLEIEGTQTIVKVGQLAQVSGDLFGKNFQMQGLRPAAATDVKGTFNEVYLCKGGAAPVEGTAFRDTTGALQFQPKGGTQTTPCALNELSIVDPKLHAKAAGVRVRDLEGLRPYADDWEFTKVPGTRGYFNATERMTGRLRLIPGRSRDHNGAFDPWPFETLPNFDMRGRGAAPAPNEVALFMAHGSPFGFAGVGTRSAARATADAVVRANAAAATAAQPQLKFVSLSSCSQGSRRFLLLGKTNAEAFQEALDMRLRELGIDPAGPKGITVLAADRPGALYGADEVKVFGRFHRTDYVPAGTQKPLRYPANVLSSSGEPLMILSSVVIVAGTGVSVVAVAEQRDPGAVLAWISGNTDKVIGYMFEAREPSFPTLELPPSATQGR
jgi:hypothetical protein